MARPRNSEAPDLTKPCKLTEGVIERLVCPPGRAQAFLRDSEGNGLRVRVTPNGSKAFVFEQSMKNKTIRRTIGSVSAWSIEKARAKAKALSIEIDQGTDPRERARDEAEAKAAATEAKRAAFMRDTLTVGEAWGVYVEERQPHWGELHYRDHLRKAAPGGVKTTRGTRGVGVTAQGPLFPLMSLPLCDLSAAKVEAWAAREAKTRPTSARLAWRLLKVFLGWCAQQPAYAPMLPDKNPAKTTKAREALGKAGAKSDVLQRGQLSAWFAHVRQLRSPVVAAALQTMLLTGARPGEVLSLRWEDLNT